MKKLCLTILSIIIGISLFCYFSIIFIIPAFINSPKAVNLVQKYVQDNFGVTTVIDDICLKVSPNLDMGFWVKKLSVTDKNGEIAVDISDFDMFAQLLRLSVKNINASYININIDIMQKALPKKKSSSGAKFNFKKLPHIKIKTLVVTKDINPQMSIYGKNIEIVPNNHINLKLKMKLDRVINDIYFGKSGNITINDNTVSLVDYSINLGSAKFLLNGNVIDNGKLGEIKLSGRNIEAGETMKTLLFLQKFTDPTKKFIENFRNYTGSASIDLVYKNNTLNGYAKINNLKARTVLFNMPASFDEAEFFIKDNEIRSFATGKAGTEVVTHKLYMKNILSKDREAFGEVKAKITEKLGNKYLPKNYKVTNYIDLEVDYYIQHRKPQVTYYAYIPKKTNIFINNFYSGIKDKEKKIYAQTYKDGINLYLKNYKYSVNDNGIYKDIVSGDGFFFNENGKFAPQYINCHTNGFVPNSFTGSFGNYVTGGNFNGNLKYNFVTNKLTGKFEVIDTIFNNFNVKSAKVLADEKLLKVDANGTYYNEKFTCKGEAKNDFSSKIYVNNMDLFLDKFVIKESSGNKQTKIDLEHPNKKISSTVRKINMDIAKWKITGNELQILNKVKLKNILLYGSIKDSVFKYNMEALDFANGKLAAKGTYDFNIDSSIIDFSAKNIDSNYIATTLFDMPNQIKGKANATLHSQTSKDLTDWKAYATFEINNGSLPQLENLEFYIKNNSKKVKMSDYVKFYAKRKGSVTSKLNGSFKCDDDKIYDANILLQHEFLSMFAKGEYNYGEDMEDIYVFGKYDNSAFKKIRIVHIPLNWIINTLFFTESSKDKYKAEINTIPKIGIDDSLAKYFKIHLKGNPKYSDLDIEIKKIK